MRAPLAEYESTIGRLHSLALLSRSAKAWVEPRNSERLEEVAAGLLSGIEEMARLDVPGLTLVVMNLDWAIRFMPLLSSAETFEFGEVECERAARLLVETRDHASAIVSE